MAARAHTFRALLVVAAAALVLRTPVVARAQEPNVSLPVVLGRAAWYVDDFTSQFENVVAEENYVQDSSTPMPTVMPRMGRGRIVLPPAQIRHRTLKSDFLLVHVEGVADSVPFRDVLEVDGMRVRDRDERLAKLFLAKATGGFEQAQRISAESTRFNLGSMTRTINNPALPLAVIRADQQDRFKFTLGKADPSIGEGVWIIEFQEVKPPTLVSGRAGTDLFAKGRLWIDVDSGRLLKSEMSLAQPMLHAIVTTTYRIDEKFAVAVPARMDERYVGEGTTQLVGVATYGNFRRFDVSVEERLNK
jgi:hypothetical protein